METAPYVEANLERAVTVRGLADVAELSTHHSKDLLRSRRASLAEVTLRTGLGSQSHFTSVFRRAVGDSGRIPETESKDNLIGNVRLQATSSAF